ncbi:MAG: LysR family transcriptional regulator [Alphaproteobacteria bacterium]|nr:LysR family transcriptional regulator [Alphaproteobacteria bacterium]
MADFDWNDLRAFLAVARTGRLTAAATRLGLDHSTLSRRIAALEHGLGAKLFDRAPTGYTLTEQGTRLVPMAEEMERLAIGAAETVGGTAANVAGTVRIGSPEGFGSWFLAPRIGRLTETWPQLRVQLVAAAATFSLAKRDADVVISVSRPQDGRLTVSRLIDYDLGLYAAPTYLAAHPPIAGAVDLKGHRFVTYIEDLLHFPELDFVRQVAPEGCTALESSNLVAQLRATVAGAGLCVLPAFLAAGDARLVRILPDAIALTRSLWLIVHQDLAELARIRAVVRFIRDAVDAERALFKLG